MFISTKIKPDELTLGQHVKILMMTCCELREQHPDDFAFWCFDAIVSKIDTNIVTVVIPGSVKRNHQLDFDTLSFLKNKDYRQVGKLTVEYRIFRNEREAAFWEKERLRHHNYHAAHKDQVAEKKRKYYQKKGKEVSHNSVQHAKELAEMDPEYRKEQMKYRKEYYTRKKQSKEPT